MRISVLGMGSMGHAVAGRVLAAGHELTVWNRSPGKGDDLVAGGARRAASLDAAFDGADAVVTSFTGDAAVLAVLAPDGGPRSGADPSAGLPAPALVDCTTVSPETSRALATVYPETFVAAPILGAPAAVAAGAAVYALGGPEKVVAHLEPLWDALSPHRLACGADPGAAATVKVINNSMLLSGLVVLAEAVATAQAAGLDDDFVRGLLSASPLVAPALHNRLDDIVDGDHDGWFAMPLGAKDLDLFVALAGGLGLDVAMATAARQQYRRGGVDALAGADVAGVVEVVRGVRP